jgi:hypothetical protein
MSRWIEQTYRDRCNLRAVGVSGAEYYAHWNHTTTRDNSHEVTMTALGGQWETAAAHPAGSGTRVPVAGVGLSFAGPWELRELAAFLAAVVEAQEKPCA